MRWRNIVQRHTHPGEGTSLLCPHPIGRMLWQGLQGTWAGTRVVGHLLIIFPYWAFQTVEHMLQVPVYCRQLFRLSCQPRLFGSRQKRFGRLGVWAFGRLEP